MGNPGGSQAGGCCSCGRRRSLGKRRVYLQKKTAAQVFFSAWVVLVKEDGSQVKYRIVGPDELGHDESWISVDSPLARALLGKKVDDEVTINTKSGAASYIIVSITY